MINCIISR